MRIFDAMGKDITYVIAQKDAQYLHVLNENIELKQQIVELHQLWDQEQPKAPQPVITEAAADGSTAQQLLGGELRVRAPWIPE